MRQRSPEVSKIRFRGARAVIRALFVPLEIVKETGRSTVHTVVGKDEERKRESTVRSKKHDVVALL